MRCEQVEAGWTGLEELPGFLKRVVGTRCRDDAEVDDVVQEACLRAALYRDSLADEQRLRPWAARIALNVLADRAGSTREPRWSRLEGEDELAVEERPDEEVAEGCFRLGPWLIEREEVLGELRRALRALRPEDRRLLVEYYAQGENCRHAAHACDMAPAVVKVRLFRARRRLGRLLRQRVSLAATRWVDALGRVHHVGART